MKQNTSRSLALLAAGLLTVVSGCRGETGPPPSSPVSVPSPGEQAVSGLQASPVPSHTPTEPSLPSPVVEPSSIPSPSPTRIPEVVATRPAEEVVVRETTVSIPVYVYEPHLRQDLDELHRVPYLWLDRDAYGEPSSESTVLRPFTAILLENRYLRLTILPELGGRIYECVFKPTGQNIFYRNQTLKPTHWGPLTRERNWWLAAGGMEWAFPVHEHGYEWGVPWGYSVASSATEATITVADTTEARPRVRVEIRLTAGAAYFTIRPRVENPTATAVSYQFWTNAMLTLGSSSMSPNTQFVFPTEEIRIHSAGRDSGLPGEKALLSWPMWQGVDLSWYRNWEDWLGFFVPVPCESFVGAYNHDTDLGLVRFFPREEVPGVKLFAWGTGSPYAQEVADEGSLYFEIWGGPNRTFWPEDDLTLEPGESKTWAERWYPFQHIGGLDYASGEAALHLEIRDGAVYLGVATSSYQQGAVSLAIGGEELYRRSLEISPESPFTDLVPLPPTLAAGGRTSLCLLRPTGEVIAAYETELSPP